MKEISSTQNQLVKTIVELKYKAAKRKEQGLCVIEGQKELEIAVASGLVIEKLLLEKNIELRNPALRNAAKEVFECSTEVMEKIAIRDTKTSIIAVAKTKYLTLADVKLSAIPFVLILENIEKPGNLGSLFRTADAANVDLILCTDMQTDIYNHNVVRNSLGCVFSKQIVSCTNQEALDFCKQLAIHIFPTYLHTDDYYYQCDFTTPTAIVFGTESTGISDFWLTNSDRQIKIPMLGKIDSMNVSNSASILLYEVVRQRLSNL
ncbi:MAG: RNA methyltransferase [Chitinophagales bacterium]|nr:RNA methyltransferase [Chitinophagales bacterium]